MKRRSTTAGGVKWLRRAEKLARAVTAKYGTTREINDGYLLEGRRVGKLRSATVIDPPGNITTMKRNAVSGRMVDIVPCGTRDTFDPLMPLVPLVLGDQGPSKELTIVFGPPPVPNSSETSWGSSDAGRNAVYATSMMMFGGVYWLRVYAESVGALGHTRSISIHENVIRALAPGYLPVGDKRQAPDKLQEPIPVVAESGRYTAIVTNVFKEEASAVPSGTFYAFQSSALCMVVDNEEGALIGKLLRLEDLPAELRPGEITVKLGASPAYIRHAQSRFLVLSANILEDSSVVASVEYAVEIEDTAISGSPDTFSTWLTCSLKVTWPAVGPAVVEIFNLDILAPTDSQRVADFGLSTTEVRPFGYPTISGTDLLDTRVVFARKAPGASGPFVLVPPYSEETRDGVVVATTDDGFGPIFYPNASSTFSTAHVVGMIVNSAEVSPTTAAVRRADPSTTTTPTAMGVLFTDGVQHHYESIGQTSASPAMWLSCPQQEVRDAEGKLVVPSTLLVTVLRGGKFQLGIRKGPIWAADMAQDYDGDWMQFWEFVDAPPTDKLQAAYYIGNPLMTRPHGAMFAAQKP